MLLHTEYWEESHGLTFTVVLRVSVDVSGVGAECLVFSCSRLRVTWTVFGPASSNSFASSNCVVPSVVSTRQQQQQPTTTATTYFSMMHHLVLAWYSCIVKCKRQFVVSGAQTYDIHLGNHIRSLLGGFWSWCGFIPVSYPVSYPSQVLWALTHFACQWRFMKAYKTNKQTNHI